MTDALPDAGRPAPSLRAQLLETAGDLIARVGLRGTTARAVSGAADVSAALLCYHFGGRDGLVLAAFEQAAADADAGLVAETEALAGLAPGPADFEDWFAVWVLHRGERQRRSCLIRRELFLQADRDERLQAAARTWYESDRRFVRTVLERFRLPAAQSGLVLEAVQALGDIFLVENGTIIAGATAASAARHFARRLAGLPPPEPASDWRTLRTPDPASLAPTPRTATEARILTAAVSLVARDGAARFTHRSLAAELGTATSVAVNRFGTRADILRATFEHAQHALLARNDLLDQVRAGGTIPRAAAVDSYVDTLLDGSGGLRPEIVAVDELLAAARHDPSLSGLAGPLVLGRGAHSFHLLRSLDDAPEGLRRMDGFLLTVCGIAALSEIRLLAPSERREALAHRAWQRLALLAPPPAR